MSSVRLSFLFFFFFNDTATTEIYTLSLHDALPIYLLRGSAPISDAGWELLDAEARARVTPGLAARKLVDFAGPHGWLHSATNLGRTSPLEGAPTKGVSGLLRRVLPLLELRADFEVS